MWGFRHWTIPHNLLWYHLSCCFQLAAEFHSFYSYYLCKTRTLWKQNRLSDAGLCQLLVFDRCLETLLVARICTSSAQVSKSVSRRWGHVYLRHAQTLFCGREADYLLSSAARSSRLTFCSSACCFSPLGVSAELLMFDQPPKKQPRGLFIQHVCRVKGRSSAVTDVRLELVRLDCFLPGRWLKCGCPLCSCQCWG